MIGWRASYIIMTLFVIFGKSKVMRSSHEIASQVFRPSPRRFRGGGGGTCKHTKHNWQKQKPTNQNHQFTVRAQRLENIYKKIKHFQCLLPELHITQNARLTLKGEVEIFPGEVGLLYWHSRLYALFYHLDRQIDNNKWINMDNDMHT